MTAEQRRVFEMFVALGTDRSLAKLWEVVKESDIDISEASIKRWSSRFHFFDLATRTDQQIVDGIAEGALPIHRERVEKELKYINKLKDKFYEQVDAGKIDVTLSDFVTLLKTERLILGDPTERREEIKTTRLEHEIVVSSGEVKEILRRSAAQEYGLPTSDTIEGETVDVS